MAIALNESRKKVKDLPKRADGGTATIDDFADHSQHSSGFIKSSTAGRTDRLPVSVHNDSYVVPADIVSGLGQGNSLAGARILDQLLGQEPNPHVSSQSHSKGRVPIIVAGGEYVVHPDTIKRLGKGNIKAGHRILDKMVANVRAHTIKKLKTLPKPQK